MDLEPNIKIWLSTADAHTVFGSGKYRLLLAIEELGSLVAAAEQLKISYRKAWGDLKEAEEHLGIPLIVKTRGGSGGGKTSLTPEGKKLMEGYADFVAEVKELMLTTFNKNLKGIFDDTLS